MYHSEFGQDKYLDEVIFKGKRNGVFFECGALDGVLDSNSLFFEQERGWTGLCVEANPDIIEKLKANRTCPVAHCAVLRDDDYAVPFIRIKGGLFGWSGSRRHIEPQHLARILELTKEEDRDTVLVKAVSLDTILSSHGLQKIDYMTLDIEGAEYSVLEVFPFEKYDIDVFEIENNWGNYPIEELMVRKGFKMINHLGVSDIYRKI